MCLSFHDEDSDLLELAELEAQEVTYLLSIQRGRRIIVSSLGLRAA